MEQIAKSVGMLCVLVFILGILFQLGCFEKTAKVIKFVIAVYIVVAIVKSVDGAKMDTNFIYDKNVAEHYDYQENFETAVLQQLRQNIEETVKGRLNEKNISYNDVSVHILEQNGNLEIEQIEVECKTEDKSAVYNCLQDLLSENTKIIVGE